MANDPPAPGLLPLALASVAGSFLSMLMLAQGVSLVTLPMTGLLIGSPRPESPLESAGGRRMVSLAHHPTVERATRHP